jgi:hypothetical protein
MERSILKELNHKNMEVYLTNRQFQNVYFPLFFPVKKTSFLTYETLVGVQNGRVAADVVSYDSSAPLKTRQVISKLTGEIPAIRVKRAMSEKDINEYNILSAMASAPDQKQLIDLVFGDVDFVFEAVQARLEWMALSALSTGVISLSTSNNNGMVTEASIDFQVPTANKTGVYDEWDQTATATPIADIRAVDTLASNNGHKLQFILMRKNTFNEMRLCAEVKSLLATYLLSGSATTFAPNIETVNNYLAAEGLPTIKIIDQSIGIESTAGVVTYSNPWSDHKVAFIPEQTCGLMLFGPIASQTNPPAQEIQVVRNNILIAKYRTSDPVNEFTRGEANAFPSWSNVDRVYLMNTNQTSTWS